MQYELEIPEENCQCHIDIEKDITDRKNGLMTFTLRVHDGRITDYNLMENVDAKTKYFSPQVVVREKQVVSYNYRKRA